MPWPSSSFYFDHAILDFVPGLEPHLRRTLQSTPLWEGEPVVEVFLYVDGSSFDREDHIPLTSSSAAAWAFVIVLQCQVPANDFPYRFYGFVNQHLFPADATHSLACLMGAKLADALSAEAVGMLWALCWILQAPFPKACYHVLFDNSTVGNFAAGTSRWTCTGEFEGLKQRIASIRHILMAQGTWLQFEHTKSHSGIPWNECIDQVAKATALHVLPGVCLPDAVCQAFENCYSTWGWIYADTHEDIPVPSAFSAVFSAEGPFEGQPCDVTWTCEETAPSAGQVTVSLRMATANVLSLGSQQTGLFQPGRIAALQYQFDQELFNVMGIQEARTRECQTRHSSTHLVFQSGALAHGHLGCELWLSKTVPYAQSDTQDFCFSHDHVTVASFAPRHILACIRAPHLQIRLLVVHAPHRDATDVTPESWWRQISQMLMRQAPELPVILLGDCNSRVGSIQNDSISSLGKEDESEAGHHFHSFLQDQLLWAPSTFHGCHEGPTHTWVSSGGRPGRLDYILIPQAWRHLPVRSWTSFDVDLVISHDDHYPACLEVTFEAAAPKTGLKSAPRLDTRKMQHSGLCHAFLHHMHQFAPVPWLCPIGQHAEALTKWMQIGAQRFFRSETTAPRQRYLSDTTWAIISTRKQFLRVIASTDKLLTHIQLSRVFTIWHAQSQRTDHMPICVEKALHLQKLSRTLRLRKLWAVIQRKRLHAAARAGSRTDRIQAADMCVNNAWQSQHGPNHGKLFRALRPLLGQCHRKGHTSFRPLPAVRLQNGTFAATSEELHERWREHFAEAENGIRVTRTQLQDLVRTEQAVRPHDSICFDAHAVPIRLDIEQYILKAKRGKTPGPDALPAELYKLDPVFFSRVLWPLLAKAALRCQEPVRWKGGEVVTVPKTSGASYTVASCRSILLADFLAKISHGLVRQRLLPSFELYKCSMQAGGVPRLGVELLQLHVQSFAQHAQHARLSSAALFVDVAQAFYRACRAMLVESRPSDESIAHLFRQNGWSPELFHAFRDQSLAPTALQQAGVSPHIQAQVRALLTGTWFRIRNQPDTLTSTATGTRPGDSVADILYAFIMTRYLTALQSRIDDMRLGFQAPLQWLPAGPLSPDEVPTVSISQAAWVDDQVLLLLADSPEEMITRLQTAAAAVTDCATEFGLKINFSKDKTSIVLHFRGPRARAAWQDLLRSDPAGPTISFQCQTFADPVSVPVVPDYVYLGSLQNMAGHPAVDVRRRFICIKAASAFLHKGIFRAPQMHFRTRVMLFNALVKSRLTFGSGAWQLMNVQSANLWHRRMMRLYLSLVPSLKPGPGVTHLDGLVKSGQVPPIFVLAVQRMALFDRVIHSDMPELWAMLQAQNSHAGWFALVRYDMCQIRQYMPHHALLSRLDQSSFQELAQYGYQHPMAYSRMAKQLLKLHKMYHPIWTDFRQFETAFLEDAQQAGLCLHSTRIPAQQSSLYECDFCAATFDTYQALCSHTFQRHQEFNVAQRFVVGNTCQACRRQYDSRQAVVQHLKYVRTGCLAKLVLHYKPLTDPEIAAIQEDLKQSRQQAIKRGRAQRHRQPVLRLPGPLLPWPWDMTLASAYVNTSVDQAANSPADLVTWVDTVLAAVANDEFEQVQHMLLSRPYTGSAVQALFHAAHSRFSLSTPDGVLKACLLDEATQQWRQHSSSVEARSRLLFPYQRFRIYAFGIRQPPMPRPKQKAAVMSRWKCFEQQWDTFDIAHQLGVRVQAHHCRVATWIPRCPPTATNAPIYLYVFSGRRRDGDFREYVELYLHQFCLRGQVLLLDLAISERHDVRRTELVEQLISWFYQGAIAAMLIAPPCETWSEARFLEGPVAPVRSAMCPLTLPGLSPREIITQVRVSNFLLYVSFRLMVAALATSTPAVMEHPRCPKDPLRPSIWRLPWTRDLLAHSAAKLVLIWQAFFQAPSAKPTNLLTSHLPDLLTDFRLFHVRPDWKRLTVLQGRTSSGGFRTALAKEYPPLMNRALAYTLVRCRAKRAKTAEAGPDQPSEIDEWLQWLQGNEKELEEQTMAPDFHGDHLLREASH